MTRVAVSGAGGRMGALTAESVVAADGLELVSAYDPGHAGEEVAGLRIASDPVVVGEADVVVEFTNPDVVMGNLRQWRELGVHAVVGTSGFDEARIAELEAMWGDGPPNCLVAPNFSIGAVLMMNFAAAASPHFGAAEIIEMHHEDKPDAPSGTALGTARLMRQAGVTEVEDAESTELLPGARGADAGIRIHSVRMPGTLAHQTVILGGDGETLTIRHDSLERSSFMSGVLLSVRSVAGLDEPVTVGIEALLGL